MLESLEKSPTFETFRYKFATCIHQLACFSLRSTLAAASSHLLLLVLESPSNIWPKHSDTDIKPNLSNRTPEP
ncbi:hypothetical protein PLICRDRAFT_270689 [Plicaturopsis crispa FD-325 SS-3]|nr:hypothetical protein PLICRDRAFT_270689 [Plicaturopsis crispa FD-325 SS-3]